ncbi:hypothetical protein AW40_07335 [Kosakonia radicincitans UMEnt01/12]|uniref:hypothetical protein n=1 Tax=Kosakonia radicincitans TaxID=283686 RepID=UPI000461C522|nr:hypothetical protein [Kosakonia radicincitans]KDE37450.1 hypothetical protein AW40_07335 [Kosakonia radicincitans UMEnt01/12]
MEALTIPVTLYVQYRLAPYAKQKIVVSTIDFSNTDPDEYLLLETKVIEITISPPDTIDIIGAQVDNLRQRKASIASSADRQIAVIDDEIQQLLCIDHSPEDKHEIPF